MYLVINDFIPNLLLIGCFPLARLRRPSVTPKQTRTDPRGGVCVPPSCGVSGKWQKHRSHCGLVSQVSLSQQCKNQVTRSLSENGLDINLRV